MARWLLGAPAPPVSVRLTRTILHVGDDGASGQIRNQRFSDERIGKIEVIGVVGLPQPTDGELVADLVCSAFGSLRLRQVRDDLGRLGAD